MRSRVDCPRRICRIKLARDGWNAKTISVMRDGPLTTPLNKRLLFAISDFELENSESLPFVIGPNLKELTAANWSCAHRKNVAHDAADAGGRALKRLDGARMIVRFDLERDGQSSPMSMIPAFSSPAPTRIFGDLVGKVLSRRLGVFVAAMLAPHDGKIPARCSSARVAEDFFGVRVFLRRQIVFGDEFGCDGGFGHGKNFTNKKNNFVQRFLRYGRNAFSKRIIALTKAS